MKQMLEEREQELGLESSDSKCEDEEREKVKKMKNSSTNIVTIFLLIKDIEMVLIERPSSKVWGQRDALFNQDINNYFNIYNLPD